ncbi:MAG: 3-hydroxyacyl-CoA dehydrogenase NAD-binding domain-containing protein [Halobacteria archaeon]|nr:3-hydroxyacyl-CoA dehydrogenase NAD-binding domain-containing protein [Halobacteria archaeon]
MSDIYEDNTRQIKRTGVVGAGLMGTDISILLAEAGYNVVLIDIDPEALENARREHAQVAEERGFSLSEDLPGINYSTDINDLRDSDFVVEAIPEDLELKRDLMVSIEGVVDEETVIGTNTSSLTPSGISSRMSHPQRVVLFHFANPALDRDLLEISGDKATEEVLQTAIKIGRSIGKEPIVFDRECRAHVLSRMSAAIKCSATWELTRYEPATIDRAAKNLGFDRGPIELIDLIGIDVHLSTVENLSEVYGDRFEPPAEIHERMIRMVEEGRLGKKTGEGFFKWDDDRALIPDTDTDYDISPVLVALINEAHRIVEDSITSRDNVNRVLKLGSGGSVGPFDLLDSFGRDYVVEKLNERYDQTEAAVFEPAESLIG